MNKRGFVDQIILIVTIAVIAIIGIAIIWGLTIGVPLFSNLFSTAGQSIVSTGSGNSDIGPALNASINPAINSVSMIQYLIYAIFFGFVCGLGVVAYYARSYPFMIVIWIALSVIFTIFGLFLSNAYSDIIASGGIISQSVASWGTMNWIMLNLPTVFAIAGFVGGVIIFMLIPRETEAEAGAYL